MCKFLRESKNSKVPVLTNCSLPTAAGKKAGPVSSQMPHLSISEFGSKVLSNARKTSSLVAPNKVSYVVTSQETL